MENCQIDAERQFAILKRAEEDIDRVARFFVVQHTKTGKNIPNNR
jgi:hypothetical protein